MATNTYEIVVGTSYGSKHPICIYINRSMTTLFMDMTQLKAERFLPLLSLDSTRTEYFETKQCNGSLVLRAQEICSIHSNNLVLAYLHKNIISGETIILGENECKDFEKQLTRAIELNSLYNKQHNNTDHLSSSAQENTVDLMAGAKKRLDDNLRSVFG